MEIPVKKPSVCEEEIIAIGQKLALIQKKYPSSSNLRDAEIPVAVTVWEPVKKDSKYGYLTEITGAIEKIDFEQKRIVVDGKRINLSTIVQITVPDSFDYSDSTYEDYSSDFNEETSEKTSSFVDHDVHKDSDTNSVDYYPDEWPSDREPVISPSRNSRRPMYRRWA